MGITHRSPGRKARLGRVLVAGLLLLVSGFGISAQEERPQEARPIRNDVARPQGEELLILRHQQLVKGGVENFYDLSREGVWPWFEKIGTRIVGQWQVIYPGGEGGSDEYDDGYRLARYASYEHWLATRQGVSLGGNGPDSRKNTEALRERREFLTGSDGAYFLQGNMAPGGPYHLPGLEENYEAVTNGEPPDPRTQPVAVRNDVAQPGREVVTLRIWKINKGAFDEFNRASREGVWPYFEKIGARIIGQWKVVYPPRSTMTESPDYDEVLMMTRYASYEHWQATRRPASLGGNGPDYEKMREALAIRQALTRETSVKFLQGWMYSSPPIFMPGLGERYRRIEE